MYLVLAYYHFLKPPQTLQDPQRVIKDHKQFFKDKDARGRIYINEQGINGQMSIHEKDAEGYITWLHQIEGFQDVEIKVHVAQEHAFAKMTVKYRKQLAALDAEVDLNLTGEHVSPDHWKTMLEKKEQDTILIDVRNQYEWKVGHFEGAILPELETFRGFSEYVDSLKHQYDAEKTKVMMYCTGGIRCELYSALMKEKGFQTVYQLQGGVIKYGLVEGAKHWKGKLFVFDDRMVVPISEDNTEVISQCHHCGAVCDVYVNCANMDCNALFIACDKCIAHLQGCCSQECTKAPRLRAFEQGVRPKPFRKLPFETKAALSQGSCCSCPGH
ncbi:MAG: rhodanese-related sulfurtransferase [Chlamydiota bacterium]